MERRSFDAVVIRASSQELPSSSLWFQMKQKVMLMSPYLTLLFIFATVTTAPGPKTAWGGLEPSYWDAWRPKLDASRASNVTHGTSNIYFQTINTVTLVTMTRHVELTLELDSKVQWSWDSKVETTNRWNQLRPGVKCPWYGNKVGSVGLLLGLFHSSFCS